MRSSKQKQRKKEFRACEVDRISSFYAKEMACASGSTDPRFEQIFNSVRREAFMPPGPWKVLVGDNYIETLSNDPDTCIKQPSLYLMLTRELTTASRSCTRAGSGLSRQKPAKRSRISVLAPATIPQFSRCWCCRMG